MPSSPLFRTTILVRTIFLGVLSMAALMPAGTSVFGAAPGGLDWSMLPAQPKMAAYVDHQGNLVFFNETAGAWKKSSHPFSHQLLPGTPLKLISRPGMLFPGVVAVLPGQKHKGNALGTLCLLQADLPPVNLCPGVTFVTTTSPDIVTHGNREYVVAVDSSGNLREIDLLDFSVRSVTSSAPNLPGMFLPGSPVSLWSAGGALHAFLVDRDGGLLHFHRAGPVWAKPYETLDHGYLPGSHVAVFGQGALTNPIEIAICDGTGELRHWSHAKSMWHVETIATGLVPGGPIDAGWTAQGPMISAVTPGYGLQVWRYETPAGWAVTPIGTGYLPASPISFLPQAGEILAFDAAGRLTCAHWNGQLWNVHRILPMLDFTPQLVSSQVVPGASLAPVEVTLVNTGSDPLLIQIADEFRPRPPKEIRIPANSEIQVTFERDPGAWLEEVFLAPGPAGTLIERTERQPIPPRQRYSLVAWSDRVTFQYIDRRKNKPKGAPPNVEKRSHVSLGVIPVLEGDLLEPGDRIDILAAVQETRNPGAVRWFPKPQTQPSAP